MQRGFAFPFHQEPGSRLADQTVLQIIPALEPGATEQTVVDLAGAVTDVGGRALVATTGGDLVSELQARGGVWVPFPADSRNPLAMANNVRKLRDVIRIERPSVIHAHSRTAAWVALGAAQITGTPLVTVVQGQRVEKNAVRLQYDSVMVRGDLVLAQSGYVADLVAASFPWARERIRIVPPGVDLRRFSSDGVDATRVQALRAAWSVAPDRRVVLMPAPIAAANGQDVLVDAVAMLRAGGLADTVFLLAGDHDGRGGYAADLDRAIAERGVGDVVRRVPPPSDRPAALLASSLVVTPTVRAEGTGQALVEAQAMGVPVVASDHGAAAEVVLAPPRVPAGLRTGWRITPGSAEALAAAVTEALAMGASARGALADRAQAHVSRGYSRDSMVEAVLDAYVAVIEGAQSQRARLRHG